MRGKAVFYPMGWDDNGLPTERRVQNYFGVRCDPSLPYDPAFAPPDKPGKQPIPVSRPNFIELCARLTAEDEKAFEHLWRHLGLSVDWSMTYATIGRRAQRVSQLAFLRLLAARPRVSARGADAVGRRFPDRGRAGRARGSRAAGRVSPHPLRRAPTADGLRRDRHDAARADPRLRRAGRASGRRALSSRCSAREVITPLFGVRVPVQAAPARRSREGHRHRDDLHVRRRHRRDLVARAVAAGPRDHPAERRAAAGRRGASAGWESRRSGARAAGTTTSSPASRPSKARARIVELLRESGDLIGEPRPITHAVKFYEKGDRPLEIVTSRQWFIKTMEFRERAAARAAASCSGIRPTCRRGSRTGSTA